VKIALACEGSPPAGDLVDLLVAAGLPAEGLTRAAGQSVVVANGVEWVLAAGADVVAAAARGAVDAAVVGKEVLLEHDPDLCELLDLEVARNRLVFATPEAAPRLSRRGPRIATRFPRTTRRHFTGTGRQVDLVVLAGPGLALSLGLADGIVELERRLPSAPPMIVREEVAPCSARLVAGCQTRALQGARLAGLIKDLRRARGRA
jgi:ATP phosphoribosyltransferase